MNQSEILTLLEQQNLLLAAAVESLARVADTLERLCPAPVAPNYQMALHSWAGFDWTRIGATVEQSDRHGATVVCWRGHQFTRRSPSNRYDPAIWFSRCTGKDERGENQYERLITFRPISYEIEPLPEKVVRLVGA